MLRELNFEWFACILSAIVLADFESRMAFPTFKPSQWTKVITQGDVAQNFVSFFSFLFLTPS